MPVATREAPIDVGRDRLISPFKKRRGAVTPPYRRESHVPSENESALVASQNLKLALSENTAEKIA
jgi:hypothetical protein